MDFSHGSHDVSFDVKRRFLHVVDWSVRTTKVIFETECFSGRVLDMVLKNSGKKVCNGIEANVRYLGSDKKLRGIDHALISSGTRIQPGEERAVTIYLTIPEETRNAIVSLNADVTSTVKEHELMIVAVALLLAAVAIAAVFFF